LVATANARSEDTAMSTGALSDDKAVVRLWLRMLTCTTLVETELRKQFRLQFDSTLPRFDVLAQLDRQPEGMTLGDLAKCLMVSPGNVTPIIERLLGDGLVARSMSETDRRVQIVSLTDEGQKKFRKMAKKNRQIMAGIFRHLEPAQIETLSKLLSEAKSAVLESTQGLNAGRSTSHSSKQ
jgi:DNA-binding MarR family transcriptional regulator